MNLLNTWIIKFLIYSGYCVGAEDTESHICNTCTPSQSNEREGGKSAIITEKTDAMCTVYHGFAKEWQKRGWGESFHKTFQELIRWQLHFRKSRWWELHEQKPETGELLVHVLKPRLLPTPLLAFHSFLAALFPHQ